MFSGIVEERGEVTSREDTRLSVRSRVAAGDARIGDSIAVNGTCLTVVSIEGDTLSFDLSEETLARTALGRLAPGDPVNLERPATLATRLGGHLVQGHVDGVGEITAVEPEGSGGARLRVRLPRELMRYVVEQGSIALDGVSLTVASIEEDTIEVALIPHTLAATTFGASRAGDPSNVEVDVMAKHVTVTVERLLGSIGGRTAWTNA
jgi:riboflavin synthase